MAQVERQEDAAATVLALEVPSVEAWCSDPGALAWWGEAHRPCAAEWPMSPALLLSLALLATHPCQLSCQKLSRCLDDTLLSFVQAEAFMRFTLSPLPQVTLNNPQRMIIGPFLFVFKQRRRLRPREDCGRTCV